MTPIRQYPLQKLPALPAVPHPRRLAPAARHAYFLFGLKYGHCCTSHALFRFAFDWQSTIQRTPVMSLVGLVVGLVLSVAKGAFGDLFRALGLASVLAVTRSHRLSAEYPFLPYARRALVMLPRRPFPPAENPWKYKRADALAELEEAGVADDGNLPAEFSMAKVERAIDTIATVLAGVGWSVWAAVCLRLGVFCASVFETRRMFFSTIRGVFLCFCHARLCKSPPPKTASRSP